MADGRVDDHSSIPDVDYPQRDRAEIVGKCECDSDG
jgi:hypothetical protein